MKMLTTFGNSKSGNTGVKPLSLSRLGTTFQFPRRAAAPASFATAVIS